jgi:C4-dicarboxylate transporter
MEAYQPPSAAYTERVYRQVVPYLTSRGLSAEGAAAGCARCQACSAMSTVERAVTLSARK